MEELAKEYSNLIKSIVVTSLFGVIKSTEYLIKIPKIFFRLKKLKCSKNLHFYICKDLQNYNEFDGPCYNGVYKFYIGNYITKIENSEGGFEYYINVSRI